MRQEGRQVGGGVRGSNQEGDGGGKWMRGKVS